MTSCVYAFDTTVPVARTIEVPDFNAAYLGETLAIERLPTEPLGQVVLTLTNVVVGSRYRIERQGEGSLATPTANAEGVAGASTVPITLDYYATGNANNSLRIKVRKASADPRYKPYETLVTLTALAQSVYIAQTPDT